MRDIAAREEDFRRLYAEHFDAVLGFALRRTDRPDDAADVTADTFLVAWRRLSHLPAGDAARPWLYGVARRVLANQRRGDGRRAALGDRLRHQLAHAVGDLADDVAHRADVTAAMKRLSARDEPGRDRGPATSSADPAGASVPAYGFGDRAVLTREGWSVDYVQDHPEHGGELSYRKGQQRLEISWRPAALYDDFVADRNDIGTPVEVDVLGKTSLMWAYSRRDHTVIRPVEGDHTLEVRGSGMGERAFRALLAELRLVDSDGFRRALPDEVILDDERPAAIAEILADVPPPDGFEASAVRSHELTRYQLVADVTGAVTCAWIERFRSARAAGDAAAVRQARDALGTARDWAALREIADDGGWSDAVWQYADIVAAGASTPRDEEMLGNALDGGLGCDD